MEEQAAAFAVREQALISELNAHQAEREAADSAVQDRLATEVSEARQLASEAQLERDRMQQLVADAQSSFAQELKDAVAQVRHEASPRAVQQAELQAVAQWKEGSRKQLRDSREAEAV